MTNQDHHWKHTDFQSWDDVTIVEIYLDKYSMATNESVSTAYNMCLIL